ncbi:unnamed protein product [Bursaphelenchus okinawaensis]|uniref:Uncharacterized protein n=1 Tax=Bursaphelenchus okinawaensis TaxID=465554 RepID=A0A811KNI5_9BILA|nr:unnamed protein product [Bursaphelenchus okinawaensis]CAG9107299.1 unnamed protein product [Bursaphelenchus okinawaensis]
MLIRGLIHRAFWTLIVSLFAVKCQKSPQQWTDIDGYPEGDYFDYEFEKPMKSEVFADYKRFAETARTLKKLGMIVFDYFCFEDNECWTVVLNTKPKERLFQYYAVYPLSTFYMLAGTRLNKDGSLSNVSPSVYIQFYVAAPFVFNNLDYKSKAPVRIFTSGLGFGGLAKNLIAINKNMHITGVELMPETVYIGKKWLGFVENDQVDIHYSDSTLFIKEAAENGTKYNYIFLDLCYNDVKPKYKTLCPINEYLEEDVIQYNYDTLTEDGLLAMNVIDNIKYPSMERLMVKTLYEKVFKWCELYMVVHNSMMVCGKKSRPKVADIKKRFNELDPELKAYFVDVNLKTLTPDKDQSIDTKTKKPEDKKNDEL